MREKTEFIRKNIFHIIKFKALYLIIQIKMILLSCLFVKVKNFKSTIPFLLTLILFFSSPSVFLAQDFQWPWVFDGPNFKITDIGENYSPSIASNGSVYLVVWYRKNPSSGFDIYGRVIGKDGSFFEEGEIPICTASYDQMFPSVAWGGRHFLVVWQDKRSGNRWDIYGVRVTPEGTVLDAEGIKIAGGKWTKNQISPALSSDGDDFLIVWQGERTSGVYNINSASLSSEEGEPLRISYPVTISASSKNQVSPAVAFDGNNYLVIWQDFRSNMYWGIYGARVNKKGRTLDFQAIQITDSDESPWNKWRPVLSWNGNYFFIIWTGSPETDKWFLYGRRVDSSGEVLDGEDLLIAGNGTNKASPALGWDGVEYMLVWEEEPGENSKILGVSLLYDPVTQTLVLSNEKEISEFGETGVSRASQPALSRIDDDILVIWEAKDGSGQWHLYGQFLTQMQ